MVFRIRKQTATEKNQPGHIWPGYANMLLGYAKARRNYRCSGQTAWDQSVGGIAGCETRPSELPGGKY